MKQALRQLITTRPLLSVLSAQTASTYANQVIAFVIPWLVLTRTGSALNAGTVAFAMGVAAFIGILFGGLVIDRIGGRKTSMIADSLSVVTALLLAVALFFDFFALWLVIISQVIGVFFDGPGMIAKNTMVPVTARKHSVPVVRAMGLQHTLQNIALFVGPLSAGLLVALLTESFTLLLATILFLTAIILMARSARQNIAHNHPMTIRQGYIDIRETITFLKKESFLGPMQFFGPFFAFMIPISILVFPAWFVLAGQSSAALGLFLAVQALGGIVGGFVFTAFGPKVSQYKWLIVSTIAYTMALGGLYFLQPGSLETLLIGFLAGIVFTGIMAIPYAAFYTRAPERLLGRLNSLGAALASIVGALLALGFGWLINSTSAKVGLLACSIGMGLIALGTIVFPFMRLLDERVDPNNVPIDTDTQRRSA